MCKSCNSKEFVMKVKMHSPAELCPQARIHESRKRKRERDFISLPNAGGVKKLNQISYSNKAKGCLMYPKKASVLLTLQ